MTLFDPSSAEPAPADDMFAAKEPLRLFADWMAAAETHEPNDPSAMALATVGADGTPDVRMVLLKGVDARGFAFYTNLESRKARELAARPVAALCFHWKTLRRQVRISGPVTPVDEAEADAYFASRPRDSQIGAWASRQSRPLENRAELVRAVAEVASRFAGQPVPRPPFWSGYRVSPLRVEFWRDRPFRLHDRLLFQRSDAASPWSKELLFP